MYEESLRLMEQIAGLSDNDLLRMVYLDRGQYQSEAITYAKAEIAKRGVNINQVDFSELSNTSISHPFIISIQRIRLFISMVIQTRAFAVGFLIGSLIFVLINVHSYRRMIDFASCCDGFTSFGFPFDWYTFGGYFGMTYIHWWKVLANIIVGFLMCLLSGWFFRKLVEKIRFYLTPA